MPPTNRHIQNGTSGRSRGAYAESATSARQSQVTISNLKSEL